jgi:DDE family transposase
MAQTREVMAPNLADRLCWQAAGRDDSRVARRLYRKQVVDSVYRLDEGALLDDFFDFLPELGVVDLLADAQGTAVQREMVPCVPYLLLYRVKTLCGIESMKAVPALLFSDEALMRLVGFKAHQVRSGVCQRGAAHRQGPRLTGPICADALADNIVTLNVRDLEAWFNGCIRALAKAGVLAAKVTGIIDATDLETTAADEGCGQVTRQRKLTDTRGKVHELEVTVYGWKVIILIEARTKIPLAVKVVPIQEHEVLSRRALVTQARTNLAGHACLHQVVFERGFLAGVDVWWLDQRGITFVVPAKENMAATVDARAHAAAGEGIAIGRRVHTVRHGPGNTAWTERLETEVVGITGLTTSDQYGTPAPGRTYHRRDVQPNLINAVVVRQWNGHAYGPAGKTVFLTNAVVDQPVRPCDDDDDRRLIEHGCIKESKQPWSVKHPPQNTARAGRVHVIFTLLRFALATAYRWPCEQEDTGGEPVGWQRWRRRLLERTRELVIVFAQGYYGIFHLAEYSLLGGHHQRSPSGDRHTAANPGQIQAHST